jgi:hypothetical protein
MDLAAASWRGLEVASPEIAEAARRLLEDEPGVPGVAFLGTVASGGFPRIHPFIPALLDGDLWAFVIESPKQRDLDRTGRFALHSLLGENDESFFCAGGAVRVDAADVRSQVAEAMPYSDIDDRHVLYQFQVQRALWTTWTTSTSPAHRSWTYREG